MDRVITPTIRRTLQSAQSALASASAALETADIDAALAQLELARQLAQSAQVEADRVAMAAMPAA